MYVVSLSFKAFEDWIHLATYLTTPRRYLKHASARNDGTYLIEFGSCGVEVARVSRGPLHDPHPVAMQMNRVGAVRVVDNELDDLHIADEIFV